MRALIFVLTICGCSPASPPQAELVGEATLSEMIYLCSEAGEESVQFTEAGAVIETRATGRACDYEQWRQDVALYGPMRTRRTSPAPYQDWQERNRPEA